MVQYDLRKRLHAKGLIDTALSLIFSGENRFCERLHKLVKINSPSQCQFSL